MKSTVQPSKIIGIQFSIGSPEEIRKNSVVEVITRDTYINNKPVMGGLFDPKMGVLEPGLICPTDGLTYINTPGYFGHIEMARPVIFIQHLKDIMKILKCVCFKCSRLLLNKKQHTHVLKMSMDTRWDYVSKLAIAIKRCGESTEDGCGCKQPSKVKLEGMATLFATWEMAGGEVVNMRITPEIILKIFRRISDEDIAFMGFSPIWSRPEWMICQVLPVPPPAVRPSVKHDAQQRSEDDLTHIYSNIIKTNRDLLDKIQNNAPANVIEGLSSVLQYFVAMIVNNKVKGAVPMAQRSGRPLQCISGRLNSKNGRVRGNLMGKRVDFSARSVITGDPNLSIRQLGVPLKVAKNITKPMIVNDLNRDYLLALVRNGPDEYPGAKILERKNGESISLRYVDRESIRLETGDIVHRHMMDGDAVLFNRQPSLHRNSMMCHIVKVMKVGDTFRINVGVTKPYNADFDGDEMNMHMPQNVLAETELRHLAAIPYQLISPTSNSPIIGIYQDSMLGSFQFTREHVSFTPKEAMNLLMMYPDVDVSGLRKKTITNFDVLSQIFPPLTMVYKNKLFRDSENFATSNNVFELRNGEYMRGRIDKSVLGSSTKGVIHRIFNDYGNMVASNFIDNLQNIITEYMKTSSFSVGISDLIANKITQERIVQVIADKKMEVQSIIHQVHLGVFENATANTNAVEFETKVNNILNKATEQSGKIGRENLGIDNRFVMIVDSGSKGSPINISQMISCLGQQNVDGKRIPYGFNDRTLPHFAKFDDSPIARGFIEDSYITGLTAPGLFFHAMGGRIGLIDTAVKTSKTGYIQRRLIKGMEYYQVYYDMTVRNDKGHIVQFAYGDDGIDSTKVENQSIPLVGMSLEDIYMHYDIPGLNERDADLLVIYSKSTITRMRKQRDETRLICQLHIADMQKYQKYIVEDLFKNRDDNIVRVPVSFQNIIANIQGQFHLNAGSIVDITPKEAFELIETYYKNLQKLHYVKPTKMFEILYYFYLSPKDLLINRRFHHKALIFLLETISLKYKQAIVSPGENVGVIAGQSIGEPTTQLTLNTFHLAGVATKSNVTRGVPRIEEILRLTKNPSSTSMTVYLKPVDEYEKERAEKYSNMIEHTKLKDVVKSVQIYFDTNERTTFIQEDQVILDQFYEFEDFVKECNDTTASGSSDYDRFTVSASSISGGGGRAPAATTTASSAHEIMKSKWIIRMEIDAEQLLDKNITMDDIHFALVNSHKSEISCVYSDYNADNLVFRIRMNTLHDKKKKKTNIPQTLDQSDEIYLLQNFQDSLLNHIVLRGITGINNVMPRKLQNNVMKEDGRYIKKESWILDTNGSNLMDVLALDYIDNTRTFSNDIKEMFDIFGIEAARQCIFNEFTEVMEFSDVYINYHHLSLLCDRMTSTKNLVPIFRSGILNDNIGPIAKATFEVHTEVFLDAARHADFDSMRGVSANVMCGQYGNYGTGSFGLVLDMKTMSELSDAIVDVSNEAEKIDNMFGILGKEEMGECSKAQIEIKNYLGSIQKEDLGICEDDYDMGF